LRYRFLHWTVDTDRFELRRGADPVPVQPKVLSLLVYLLEHRDRTVAKRELLDAVWPDAVIGESSLTRAVSVVRSALGETEHDGGVIRTVRGRGYRIGVPVVVEGPAIELRQEQAPASDFVCREQELALARGSLHEALAGRGQLLLLVGEPGIGKTRLAAELASIARQRGAAVLWGGCQEGAGGPSYWPWVRILRAWLREWGADALHGCLGNTTADLAELVPEIRERLPELPMPDRSDLPGARGRLFHAVSTLLVTRAAETPVVVVLDDLHAADQPSLLMLRFLVQELGEARMLVVGTYRDTEVSSQTRLAEALAELARAPHPKRKILLRGLTRSCVQRFIARSTGVEPAPDLVDACYLRSEGNPLFLLELVHWLESRGHELTASAPPWTAEIPEGVRAAIVRRLAGLSGDCHPLLTAAAVIGREFSVAVLARVCDLDETKLLERLEEAERARIVKVERASPGMFHFSHTLIGEVLYAEIATAQRVQLHQRVGEVLEQLYTPHPIAPTNLRLPIRGARLAELSHHFCEAAPAGSPGKAADYCARAGDHAMGLLAFDEAAGLYQRGLAVLEVGLPGDESRRERLLAALTEAKARIQSATKPS
jgi:predicted ATPase